MVREDHPLRNLAIRVGLQVLLPDLHSTSHPLDSTPFALLQVPPRPRVLRAYKTVLVAPNAWLEELFRFLVEGTGVRDLRCRRRWGVEGGRRGVGGGSGGWVVLNVRHLFEDSARRFVLKVRWGEEPGRKGLRLLYPGN